MTLRPLALAALLGRVRPAWHTRFAVVVCSGLIAGEGIAGAGVSIWQMIAG